MAVQINVAANQAALTASIQAGVQAYNQRFAQNNQLNLTVNQRAFSQPLGRMTGDVKDFEAALAASNARVIAFGASTAVLGGVIRSFKELANVTIEVEKNLADINRVFGLTTSQLQKFSTDLFNVTKQTASSFDDASKAALEFSRQGLKAEETLQRTKDALTLTRLAGIGTANAVDALTSTVNGFAATGITTTQILNKLVAVEQDYAVGAGDLAEALSRTGQAAQEAGVSLDQLNALVTSAQQSTARGGAVIGNALKTIFTRLQRTDTLDQLEAFNISVRDVQGNILPAVQILQNFAGAYRGLADAQRAQLSEQVAGVYQVNILKAIVNDLNKSQGTYAGALQRGASATNEAEIATAKLNQTLDALLKQTATSTQQLANNIGKVTFEPLAKYGTEQLKSFVESMNEILEGEGVGSTFANGLLKGIRNVIAGPGAIAAFFTLFKLIQNSFTYLSQALPQIAGITTETQNRKNIEQSILQIMQQQGPASQALAGMMGNQAAQAQLLLQIARQQTAEYQMQSTLAKQLAAQLATQGVRVKGSGGLQVTRAGGYIPAATRMAEVVGAQAGGYAPGRVVSSPVGGVMNTAEDVKYIPGFAQPFINPPAGSKAGRAHRQNAISRTGVDPYMFNGFIPNFVKKSPSQFSVGRAFEQSVGFDIKVPPSRNKPIDFKEVLEKPINKNFNPKLYQSNTFADAHSGLGHTSAENISKVINHIGQNYYAYSPKQGSKTKRLKIDDKTSIISQPDLLGDLFIRPRYTEIIGEGLDVPNQIKTSSISSLNTTAKKTLLNGVSELDFNSILRRKIKMQFAQDRVYGSGFIPNFATPMSTASIPWFKKYSSKYKNASGDTDLFKMGDFPTYGRGLDHEYAKKGNSAMLSYLHEDFVRSALNIALGSKKVIRPAEVGFKNKPVSDIANENDFDLLYRIADGSYSMLELKQDFKNVSGSVTGFMNKKLANLEKENPVLAKKVSSMIAVSNRPKFTDPTGRNAGANFSEFEMAAASIVKDKYSNVDPSISAKLTKVTDGLLRRYEVKKNSYSKGFIPNFASRSEMIRDLIRFNLESTPDVKNKNVFGSKTTLFRGVKNRGGRYSGQFGRDIFEQSNNYSQAKNSFDYFRNTDINEIANDHVSEKKLLPFVSASMDEDIAKYFARGRQDSSFSDEGKVGSKTIKNSRIFSAESIRKFTNKYGQEALKQLMMEHSTWGSFGSGKGIAMNFQSFSDKKGFEGTDFAKEISFLSKGFVPNFADFIDVDTLTKNSVHYSGDLMKLIKDIESSIGRNLSSGELRFLSSPKTDLSKLNGSNGPNVLNRFINSERKGGFAQFAKGFLPNFNFIKGRNSFQKNWLIETAKKRNLNLNDPNVFSKLGAEFAKTYPNDQGMFGLSEGFIPNFAYKQAVMGLEESMSGNKAIFDTKPFPHIRNSSQPTFSSAIADHGGLGNALSDSMRGQKAAGLMHGGFIPNFGNSRSARRKMARNQTQSQSQNAQSGFDPAILQAEAEKIAKNVVKKMKYAYDYIGVFAAAFADTIEKGSQQAKAALSSGMSKIKVSASNLGANVSNSVNNAASNATNQNTSGGGGKSIIGAVSKRLGRIAANPFTTIAGNMLAGQIESFYTGGKSREKLTEQERFKSSAFSNVLASGSTGLQIGGMIGGAPGAVIGGVLGGLTGLITAINSSKTNLDDLTKIYEEKKIKEKESFDAASEYIQAKSKIAANENIKDANKLGKEASLAFANIKDSNLKNALSDAGNDVVKMTNILNEYTLKQKEATLNIETFSANLVGLTKERAKEVGMKTTGPTSGLYGLEIVQSLKSMLTKDTSALTKLDLIDPDTQKAVYQQNEQFFSMFRNVQSESLKKIQAGISGMYVSFIPDFVGNFEKSINSITELSKDQKEVLIATLKKGKETGSVLVKTLADPAAFNKLFSELSMYFALKKAEEIITTKNAEAVADLNFQLKKSIIYLNTRIQDESRLLNQEKRLRQVKSKTEGYVTEQLYGKREMASYQYKIAMSDIGASRSIKDLDSISKVITTNVEGLSDAQKIDLAKTRESLDLKDPQKALAQMRGFAQRTFGTLDPLKLVDSQKTFVEAIDAASEELRKNSKDAASDLEEAAAQLKAAFEEINLSSNFMFQFKAGFRDLANEGEALIGTIGRQIPKMFADGLVDGIKAAIRESDNLGQALMGIAAKFLDELSTMMLRSSIYQIMGSFAPSLVQGYGVDLSGSIRKQQKGGVIRAQSGMYVSGSGTGDKYPALLENGEYVLNRRAVMAMGGPASLDQLNFAMAPRFASGGSFSNEFIDLKSMESNMTSYGMENSKLYGELRDAEVAAAEERRRKAFARKQQRAGMIGSLVAAVASIGLAQGMSNITQNAQSKQAQALSGKLTSGANLTKAESASIKPFIDKGLISPYSGAYTGGSSYSGVKSFFSGPTAYGQSPWYQKMNPFGKQTGGLIGSRLSDTIPGYMEGGLYNTPIVKRYGVGMQSGGMSPVSNSNSNVVNTTNATNSFNFNTNVSRDGTIEVGSNSTSYAQQDVALSKNLNSKVYAVVLDAIKNEQRFGGSLAGTRQG